MSASSSVASSTKTPKKPTQAQLMKKLGLVDDMDFIVHLPLRYEDQTQIFDIASLAVGEYAQIEGTVVQQNIVQRPRRQLHALIRDQSGELLVRLLHFYPNQIKQFAVGNQLRLRGEVRRGYSTAIEMVHPKVSQAGAALAQTLTPIYPTTEGLSQSVLRKAILAALERVNLHDNDTLPTSIRQQYGLMDFSQAVRQLHYPQVEHNQALLNQTHPAWQRIKFDELLAQQLSLAAARTRRAKLRAPKITPSLRLTSLLAQQLGFTLTQAQQRVIAEIAADLNRDQPMHRLLQGDVGSGKTVVAAYAALQAIEQGYQVALMAPTELLAEQHQQKLQHWLAPLGLEVTWLSGSLTVAQRKTAYATVQSGSSHLIVGTQALIQEAVHFACLGLVILDEQHRFGVEQRLTLSAKGTESLQEGMLPHQLNMSATPIPRTLAMTFYSDLDVSVIDELPPGRSPVQTKLLSADRREEMMARIQAAVSAEGQQVYWVCPLVEESEALQLQTAVDTYELMKQELAPLRLGLLHGRMSTLEKNTVMNAFRAADIDVLVATTVIEVGVDVPNATIMVIEHAERFGLAQLHQLRGRVGRGAKQSYCVLLYQTPLSAIARERLRAMYETTDGFEIAQRDLALRGPGEFLGIRQSGQMLLRFANLEHDQALIEQAKACAVDLYNHQPEVAVNHVQRWLGGKEDFLRS